MAPGRRWGREGGSVAAILPADRLLRTEAR